MRRREPSGRETEGVKQVQSELKVKIQQIKDNYRRKLELKLQQNNVKDVWSGMRSITGYKQTGSQVKYGDLDWANKLNLFFNRFHGGGPVHPSASSSTTYPSLHPCPAPGHQLSPTELKSSEVRSCVDSSQARLWVPTASGRGVLKACASQLCRVLQHIFNLSLSQKRVLVLWKISCLVPVPKKARP